MPWFWRSKRDEPASAPAPPVSPELEAKLKDLSCAIQACLKKNGYQLDACTAQVDALRACCRAEHAWSSVHCTAGWVNGGGQGSKQKK
jgi:hypothetical protein